MADLTELYKAQASINAQIKTARAEAAKNGEVIIIDGKEYDSTMDFEGELPNPVDTDYFPTYRKDDNGDIAGSGEITYKALVEKFASEATTIKNQAIDAGNEALESISTAKSDALSSIGQSDTTGARGDAITSITTAKTGALDEIGRNNTEGAWKGALDDISSALANALASIGESDTAGARGNAITSITNALNAALSSIGKTDDEGARKAALDAIQAALTAALSSIGQTDSEGARKDALDAIASALQDALNSIGQTDDTGVRGDAITAITQLYQEIQAAITQANSSWDSKVNTDNSAWDSKVSGDKSDWTTGVTEDKIEWNSMVEGDNAAFDQKVSGANSAFDQKVSQANTTIDGKVTEATNAASNAATSASNAAESEENAQGYAEQINGALDGYYTKSEVNTLISNLNTYKILNADEVVTGTTDTVQTVCTQYVQTKYSRAPQKFDTIIITLTDRNNDKVSYTYSDVSNIGLDIGSNAITISEATDTVAGIMKKYNSIGTQSDGAITPAAVKLKTDELATAINNRYTKQQTDNLIAESFGSASIPVPELHVSYASEGDNATLSCTTDYSTMEGTTVIRYTDNGTLPLASSPVLSGSLTLNKNCVITVRAFVTGSDGTVSMSFSTSIVVSGLKVQTPEFSASTTSNTVTLSCATVGAVIRYTLDGSEVSEQSAEYTAPFAYDASQTVKAKAFKDGLIPSDTFSNKAEIPEIVITA